MSKTFYSTKDIYLASTLLSLGFVLDHLEKKDKIFYFFFCEQIAMPDQVMNLNKDLIQKYVNDYWEGALLIDPKKLFNAFREVKARMYS